MDVQPAAGSTGPGGHGERHHAVIVFAVVGYSRLMADDEPGTLNRWARLATFAHRRQPLWQPETGAAYMEGLRAAGLPD